MSHRILLATAFCLAIPVGASALTVNLTDDAQTLVAAVLAPSSGISVVSGSAALIGGAAQQGTYGGFNLTSPSEPTLTLTDGAILTTGGGNFSTSTNSLNNFNASSGTGSFAPLVSLGAANGLSSSQFDSNVLSFDFMLDDPSQNSVTAQFIFATDEFPTQSVTDILGIFVNGTNFAFFPNGTLVSNQSGDPSAFFNNNEVGSGNYGIEWNGLTNAFSVTGLANGNGELNTLQIAIADTSDSIFDSAVFVSNLKAGTSTGGGGIDPVPAVPLPAAGWLLFGGLGALGVIRRRRSLRT